jgi:hypothetical protein
VTNQYVLYHYLNCYVDFLGFLQAHTVFKLKVEAIFSSETLATTRCRNSEGHSLNIFILFFCIDSVLQFIPEVGLTNDCDECFACRYFVAVTAPSSVIRASGGLRYGRRYFPFTRINNLVAGYRVSTDTKVVNYNTSNNSRGKFIPMLS